MKLLILADDFTGAMDTGVQFARRGAQTAVLVQPERAAELIPAAEVLVVNADSRHDSPSVAREKLESLLQRFAGQWECLYLKTDSALRGNLSASFSAVLAHTGQSVCFVPAFPDAGRITRGGVHYVDGVPLGDSHFRQDPLNPVSNSQVAAILQADYPVRVWHHNAGKQNNLVREVGVHMWDCENNETLRRIAQEIRGERWVAAGCAGFASALAEGMAFPPRQPLLHTTAAPLIVLSGSANQVTFQQIQKAKADGVPVLTIPAEVKQNPESADLRRLLETAQSHIAGQSGVIVATAQSSQDLADGGGAADIHHNLSRIFADLGEGLLQQWDSLVVFGGDTIQSICHRLECGVVFLDQEVVTGVPSCHFVYQGRTIRLITKSGGLAPDDVIAAIGAYLRG